MRSERTADAVVERLRRHAREQTRQHAELLRRVHAVACESRARTAWLLGEPSSRRTVLGTRALTSFDLERSAAKEIELALGLPVARCEELVDVASALCGPMTATLRALEVGRLDAHRAGVLALETRGLPDSVRCRVEATVLEQVDGEPWHDVQARTFLRRVRRAVADVREQDEAALADDLARQVRQESGVQVRIHEDNPLLTTLTVTGATSALVPLAETLHVRAGALDVQSLAGRTRGQAQVDLVVGAVLGDGSAGEVPGRTRTRHDVGIVLHVDTVLGSGPASAASGELRGVGAEGGVLPVPAASARLVAQQALRDGGRTCVLLADSHGHLVQALRVGRAPAGGWTREGLEAAARAAYARRAARDARRDAAPDPGSYVPDAALDLDVRLRDPVCTFPGCGVPASRCDLDHVVPWPRGRTCRENLGPRSRRCHNAKTVGLWRARTTTCSEGNVDAHVWTSPLGTECTVGCPVLPGYAPGECDAVPRG